MKSIPINPPNNSIAQGTGLDFSDEQMNEEIHENEVDDDDDWEPYDLDDL
jgi:hypothetical protein